MNQDLISRRHPYQPIDELPHDKLEHGYRQRKAYDQYKVLWNNVVGRRDICIFGLDREFRPCLKFGVFCLPACLNDVLN